MVQLVTCRIMNYARGITLTIMVALPGYLDANLWDDIVGGLKTAAHSVDDAFKKAGNAIADRFRDTKVTRAVDYGVRKAAFETALKTAQFVLDQAKTISAGTLEGAEKTAQLALSGAEHFLSDVVQAASPEILHGSATAAQGAIEVAKQTGVATLKGTQWVVSHVADQFDITRIHYEGDLKRLERGVLGDVSCEGKLLGKAFAFNFDLDPRSLESVAKSIEPLLVKFGDILNDAIAKPLQKAFDPLVQQVEKLGTIKKDPTEVNALVYQAAHIAQASNAPLKKIQEEMDKTAQHLIDATTKLQTIAQKTNKELEDLIRQGVTSSGSVSTLSRQEYIKRLKAGRV